MKKYIMSFDQGTTSCRCILFDKQGNQVSTAQKEITQIYPQGGWVEHDAMEIWSTQIAMASEAMQRIRASADEIAAIGITNQRETTVVWDKRTGKPVYNAIVWQCRRTAGYCDQLKEKGLSDLFREKTGLLIDSYFSGTKLKWILDNIPSARKSAEEGNLLFGTMDTWLIWNLTGGKVHASDYSNAARTMMYNIHQLDWDEDILKELDIPKAMLPQVFPSLHIFGETEASLLGSPIPIAGSAGDQQAALFGQCCFSEGMAKNTYGTGCFLLMNTGEKPVLSESGLLTTIAWGEGGKVYYALEGSIFIGGAVIQWLRDEMKLLSSSAASEQLASEVSDTAGVYLVPAFVGLGAPYWDPYARGAMVGLTRGAGRNHIVRAALESIAYQTSDILKAMEEDSGIILSRLKVDGGACANNFLMQFQSDIIDTEVVRPKCLESTALGAAFMAGLQVEFWAGKEELPLEELEEKTFKPDMDTGKREQLLEGWKKAVKRASHWEN